VIRGLRYLALIAGLTLALSASAQDTTAPAPAAPITVPTVSEPVASVGGVLNAADYAVWESIVARAEEAISVQRASSEAFLVLRQQIADWRTRFAAGMGQNDDLIASLREQIVGLGPGPAEGVTEAPELATQRTALSGRLDALAAPVRGAEVANARAEALIRAIDRILRERQTGRLLELGPSPLNPAHWPQAAEAGLGTLRVLRDEVRTAWTNPIQRTEMRNNLPLVMLLVAIGSVLILRGRLWIEGLAQYVQTDGSSPGRFLLALFISLGQVVVPVLALVLLVGAVELLGLFGLRGEPILQAVPEVGFAIYVARWLGARMFPKTDGYAFALNLPPERRSEGRFDAGALGLIVGLGFFVETASGAVGWAPEARVVLLFPFVVLAAFLLVRLARLLRQHVKNDEVADGERSYRNSLVHVLSRVVSVVAILGAVVAGLGYFEAGVNIVYPTFLSLQLMALLMVLQRVVTAAYALITGARDNVSEALFPVLAGFFLAILSLPGFALIWGAKTTDLIEIWAGFSSGVAIGDTRISPAAFLTFAVVFALGYMATRLVQGTLKSSVLPKTSIDPGGQNAIVSGLGYVGIFLAALAAVTSAGIDLSGLAIVAGALSVGIGFGLQNIVSNFVSGIILLIERPISEGDWIEVGGKQGYVRDISVRSTRIETFDRTDVIVPNADFVSGMVTNYTRGKTLGRLIVPVGVAYGNDTRKVEAILREIAEAHPMVLATPKPLVLFMGFGADSLNFEIRVILRDVNWSLSVRSEMNHQVYERFRATGIEIPYPQRDVWIRNPEALAARPAADPKSAT
jgi:small-conductance mechanosensitive channel